jgi:SnoaL-like protein
MTNADVITRMLHAIDALDWAEVKACFTDPVRTDYTSLWGGQAKAEPADDLVAQWAEFASGFGATQHLTGPLLVSGDLVRTHVTAHHWRPGTGQAWVVHGHYTARLTGGKIAELTLHTFHAGGDPDLPSIPAQRAAG